MKPLAGVRVIEVGAVVLAPYAASLLADMGATVVKIEPLEGDSTRSLGHAEHPGMASLFLNCNRGKQSVAMDLRQPEALAALRKLVAQSDVFLHNMRADSAERLGIGYEALRELNPKMVYCASYGYGAAGRGARRPAYDDIIQAGCGIASIKGRVDGQPAYAPTIIADKTTALFVVIGIMGALMERVRTGEGRQLEVPMLETMTHFMSVEHLNGLTWEEPRAPSGYLRLLNAFRRPHRTLDGYLAVMPHSESQWKKFFTAVGRADVLSDPRFATASDRSQNIEAMYIIVSEVLPTRTSAEWVELFTEHDVPYGPVNSLEDLTKDPHLADVGFWHQVEHPTEGTLRVPSFPVRDGGPRGDATPSAIAPGLGQHTREVLRSVGYSESEIDTLITSKAVRAATA
ncbi:CaiB/BaiF CoA transferase family protein [Hydrogenophaga sp. BPS33]|uniref:CaiB/BaiF CoA transferase family protein n=1 Tax=Hydrogenophaga sp. BPS33 TaxID=2651974 RepID=UPI00131FCA0E|nr:CoA transferase [Hydrogenophaga sp. BPS33]QHE84765.1 CoA transferase [Hydrogenophaga sp. BPS33]